MKQYVFGYFIGMIITSMWASFAWVTTDEYKLGQEVQKVIDVCEEKLPRNEKCTFMVVPESKLIYDEEKGDE